MDNLDDILNGNEPEAVEVVETPAETPETPQAEAEKPTQPRGPDGKFAPKGEEVVAPPATEEPAFDHAATIGERRRRQEAEQERDQLRQQLAQLQTQQQPPQPTPDMFEDPDGWQQQFGQGLVQTAVDHATMRTRLEMSEMMSRQAHPDFEEKATKWVDLINSTPGLRERGLASAHPWDFAYNYVTNHERMEELSATNVTDLEAKLREKIMAELAAKQPLSAAPIPETLATAQSARGSISAYEPPSLEQLLKG